MMKQTRAGKRRRDGGDGTMKTRKRLDDDATARSCRGGAVGASAVGTGGATTGRTDATDGNQDDGRIARGEDGARRCLDRTSDTDVG